MVEEKIKKKLTLTISSKKTFSTPSYIPSGNKKSVVIEKKFSKTRGTRKFMVVMIKQTNLHRVLKIKKSQKIILFQEIVQ